MRRAPLAAAALLLGAVWSGCLGDRGDARAESADFPPGWDEAPPEQSRLADVPFYDLTQSTTFLLKGHSYGRYVVRVPEAFADVRLFFSTTNLYSTGRAPTVDDPDRFHYEFMQVRPVGQEVRTASVDAESQFRHADVEGVFTLTYLYGQGTNFQFLAPYEGDPDHWRLDPGYYEFVVATDEALTVGINVKTGSPFWTTLYDPQELGTSRAEALEFEYDVLESVGGKLPDQDRDLRGLVRAVDGERLNYFTFADVWYDTKAFSLGTTATATVGVDGETVPHQLALTNPGPGQDEAYAFAMGFNQPGPTHADLTVRASFHEELSADSTMVVMLMVFGVALHPLQSVPGLPAQATL